MHKNGRLGIHCYFDGCCEPTNPGGTAAYGAVIYEDDKRLWECSQIFRPGNGKEKDTSNNVAEYLGFEAILRELIKRKLQIRMITVYGDSRLVIKQMFADRRGRKWRIRRGLYVPHAQRCRKLIKEFPNIRGKWLPREDNEIADELSKRELKNAGVEFRLQPE